MIMRGFGQISIIRTVLRIYLFQMIGHWYEVEKSFNFPEIATGCTTMQFTSEAMQKDPNIIMPRLEVAVKNINEW